MKTAGGEYVAPMIIESFFLEALPFASQVIAIGDGRKFVSILMTFKCKIDEEERPTDDLSPGAILALSNFEIKDLTSVSAALKDPRVC